MHAHMHTCRDTVHIHTEIKVKGIFKTLQIVNKERRKAGPRLQHTL